jgi:hypothetical protein
VTIVLDLTIETQPIHLRAHGFESATVTAPDSAYEHRRLRRFYGSPLRANSSSFTDELVAMCLAPRRRPSEVTALSKVDRSRLRHAVIAACGRKRQWRALQGSHLTADERLFAVMYWRWREHENLRARLREGFLASHECSAGATLKRLGFDPAALTSRSNVMDLVLRGVRLPTLDFSKFVMPSVAAAIKDSSVFGVQASVIKDVEVAATAFARFLPASMPMVKVAADALTMRASIESRFAPDLFNVSVSRGVIANMTAAQRQIDSFGTAMGMGVLQGLNSVTRAAIADWEGKFAAAHIGAGFRHLTTPSLLPSWPTSVLGGIPDAWRRQMEPLLELMAEMELVDKFERRWQHEVLFFLLSGFLTVSGVRAMSRLAKFSRSEVEAAVLLALETVVLDGRLVTQLSAEVASAPLREVTRIHLKHALEHAAKGEWVRASASLYPGLEGAFWEAGYARVVVTAERKVPASNKEIGFDGMVKLLDIEPEFKTFIVRGIFGTVGNPFRHGDADTGHRRQVLLGVVAIAGWCERFANTRAQTILVTSTAKALPTAIERVEFPALPPGE